MRRTKYQFFHLYLGDLEVRGVSILQTTVSEFYWVLTILVGILGTREKRRVFYYTGYHAQCIEKLGYFSAASGLD